MTDVTLNQLDHLIINKTNEFHILHELALILNGSHDIDYIILQSANKFKEITNSTGCHISFSKRIRDSLKLETAIHSGPKPFPQGVDETKGISGTVFSTGETIIVYDAVNDPRVTKKIQEHFGHKSLLAVPINVRGDILGVIVLYSMVENNYSVEMGSLLSILGTHLGMAIENANLMQELERAATIDPLTNVYNYRYFRKELELIAKNYYNLPTSLIMIDVNDFKIINDTYGHLCGDRILRSIASTIKANINEGQIAARYGGDEFIIIIPKADIQEALETAVRIEKEVANQEFMYVCHGLNVTISWGISCANGNEIIRCLDSFIDTADQKLYTMKNLVKKGLSCGHIYT